MSTTNDGTKAGISPGEQAAMLQRGKEAQRQHMQERQALGISLENILGKDGQRSTDQQRVWDYLTHAAFGVSRSMDTNALLIFEGQRRMSAEIIVLVEQAHEPL